MKSDFFDKFITSYARKEVKGMKDAYDTLQDFGGQQDCIDFYVGKVTESLEM